MGGGLAFKGRLKSGSNCKGPRGALGEKAVASQGTVDGKEAGMGRTAVSLFISFLNQPTLQSGHQGPLGLRRPLGSAGNLGQERRRWTLPPPLFPLSCIRRDLLSCPHALVAPKPPLHSWLLRRSGCGCQPGGCRCSRLQAVEIWLSSQGSWSLVFICTAETLI